MDSNGRRYPDDQGTVFGSTISPRGFLRLLGEQANLSPDTLLRIAVHTRNLTVIMETLPQGDPRRTRLLGMIRILSSVADYLTRHLTNQEEEEEGQL